MSKSLDFAVAMEQAIVSKLQSLGAGCSAELAALLEQVTRTQQAFVQLLSDASCAEPAAQEPDLDIAAMIGSDAEWAAITSRFQPGTAPAAIDIAALWSVYSMLDKMAQYYLQAAKQVDLPQQRLFFSSLAEVKQKLRRRVGAVEQIQANQVWKQVGFPPGLLGKE
jgi:hypothetical protein